MNVGILGSGPVARGLAVLLSRAGHQITLGTGHPDAGPLGDLPATVTVGTFAAAAAGDVIILAVRQGAARQLIGPLREPLSGKVVIDTMNAWIPQDYAAAGLSDSLTEGSWLARQLPQSRIVRAFSHIGRDLLVPAATAEPGTWGAAYAADDSDAKGITETLIRDTGYVPVLVGRLDQSAPLDPGGFLWPLMMRPAEMTALIRG